MKTIKKKVKLNEILMNLYEVATSDKAATGISGQGKTLKGNSVAAITGVFLLNTCYSIIIIHITVPLTIISFFYV